MTPRRHFHCICLRYEPHRPLRRLLRRRVHRRPPHRPAFTREAGSRCRFSSPYTAEQRVRAQGPTQCLSAERFICKLNCGRGRVMLGLDPSISGQGRVRTAMPLPYSRMGEGGAERRMRACHLQQEGATAPSRFNDQRRSLTSAPLPSGRGVPRAPAQARTAIPRPRSHAGVTNEGQRSAARRVGYQAASVEPGCGADGLSHHPHAPWRSACRRFSSPGRAYEVEGHPSPRALSTPVQLIALSRLVGHGTKA